MKTITIVNNVVGHLVEIKVDKFVNIDHLSKAFDMGSEAKVVPYKNGIAIFYTNGHITQDNG